MFTDSEENCATAAAQIPEYFFILQNPKKVYPPENIYYNEAIPWLEANIFQKYRKIKYKEVYYSERTKVR